MARQDGGELYRVERGFLNVTHMNLDDIPKAEPYGIPVIKPNYAKVIRWTGFDAAVLARRADRSAGVHFFIDDYRFERVWAQPNRYIEKLKGYGVVLSPDFSLYTDLPVATQIWNHYRKHWCAVYWQKNGIRVIPTICWSDEKSFEWCFTGEPKGAVVAVSSVGIGNSDEKREAFQRGYEAMLRALEPNRVIFFGKPIIPDRLIHMCEFDWQPHVDRFEKNTAGIKEA